MKLVANIQLTPTKDEAKLLRQTLEACNAACNAASQLGFENSDPRRSASSICKRSFTRAFGMTSVDGASGRPLHRQSGWRLQSGQGQRPQAWRAGFRKHGAQPYDDRIFRFLPGVDQVSIWTLTGRIKRRVRSAEW
jgi:putative transposase